jgi:hypothetical protein
VAREGPTTKTDNTYSQSLFGLRAMYTIGSVDAQRK